MFPKRFPTINGGSTANPAELYRNKPNTEVFEGFVGDYDFKHQYKNFIALTSILRANGTELSVIAAANFDGKRSGGTKCRQVRFVATTKDGSLIWYKYAGRDPAGNQNDVYVGGKRMHLSVFLGLEEYKQRALLGGIPSIMAVVGV